MSSVDRTSVQTWAAHANTAPLPAGLDRRTLVFECESHLVPAGDEAEYYARYSDGVFRADAIEIAADVAPFFELVGINVGHFAQNGPGTLPCSDCCPSAPLLLYAARPNEDICILVRNTSNRPAHFRAKLHGGCASS